MHRLEELIRKKILFIFAISLGTISLAWGQGVSVFYSSAELPKAREKALKSALGDFDVVVYAKYKDFAATIKKNPTDVVLAPSNFLDGNKDYEKALELYADNSKSYKYLLLALDAKWKGGDISKGKVGMVAIAKRKALKKYAKKIFGKKFKRIKSVSKAEDLFPLLVFKSVDFIMISPNNLKKLRDKFKTEVVEVGQSKEVDFPKVYVKKGADKAKVKAAFSKLSKDTLGALGFSKIN